MIDGALEKYPKDALVPKFSLLNAFNIGKTAGKEIMILQLEQISLNYAKTPEGEKAAEMLKYLKSDLQVESLDETGNVINANQQPVPSEDQKEMPDTERRNGPPSPPGANTGIQETKTPDLKGLQPERAAVQEMKMK